MSRLHVGRVKVAGGDDRFEIESRVERYLPGNYVVVGFDDDEGYLFIAGIDRGGWTFDDYVGPRLASGLIFVEEVV